VSDEALSVGDCERSDGTPPDADDSFDARELAFIEARSKGKTIKVAAKAARPPFPYSTARRLDDREDVRAAVRKRAREAVQCGTLALGQAATTAARTLKRVAAKGGPGDGPRVSAARTILELGSHGLDLLDFDSRLSELEAAQGRQPGAPGFRRG
jgi:hypothetical protein